MSTTAPLYEITNARLALDSVVAEAEGELTPQWETAFDQIDGDWNEKAERCALWIKERLANAELIKAEEERLEARRKALVRDAEGLTRYLQQNMEAIGKTKVNGLLVTLSLRKNTRLEELVPGDQIAFTLYATHPELVRFTPQQYALDKNAVKDALKAGTLPENVAKCIRLATTTSLQIR